MNNQYLNQVLVLNPRCDFATIDHALTQLGWHQERHGGMRPLIANEPEVVTWTWQGNKPMVIYTFNPVVKLRCLEVATVPPVLRGAIAKQLPLLDDQAVAALFDSDDMRERLLGLYAAQETERVDLLKKAEQLSNDQDSTLASEARDVRDRLQRVNEARVQVLTQMRLLAESAGQLIRQLSNNGNAQPLKPTEDDLRELFDESLVPDLKKAIETIYQSKQIRLRPIATNADLNITACPAGLLRWQNMLSEKFPGAYRDLAGWMNPRCIWVCWRVSSPTGRDHHGKQQSTTVSYDGLVYVNQHWCWLPKIYRHVVPHLFSPEKSSNHIRH